MDLSYLNCDIFDKSGSRLDVVTMSGIYKDDIDLTVFISCYNESETVIQTAESNIRACFNNKIKLQIIFIDDLSTDNSADVILSWMKTAGKVIDIMLICRKNNAGLGANYRLAAILSSGNSFRLCCGDNVEPFEQLEFIYSYIKNGLIIVPFHNVVINKGYFRLQLSKFYTFLVNCLNGHKIRYYNGLPIIPRLILLQNLNTTRGFGFQAEILSKIITEHPSIRQVGITASHDEYSTSISIKNILSVLHVFLNILIGRISFYYHIKIKK